MYQVYIIYSTSKDRYYIGSTSVGIETRLKRHNEGWTRSTKNGVPWELKFVHSYPTKSEALVRERFIKNQKSRAFIETLIGSPENNLD